MTPILNITLSDIKDLNVVHQVNKGRVEVWEIKRILIQIIISCEALVYFVKCNKSVVLIKYP